MHSQPWKEPCQTSKSSFNSVVLAGRRRIPPQQFIEASIYRISHMSLPVTCNYKSPKGIRTQEEPSKTKSAAKSEALPTRDTLAPVTMFPNPQVGCGSGHGQGDSPSNRTTGWVRAITGDQGCLAALQRGGDLSRPF